MKSQPLLTITAKKAVLLCITESNVPPTAHDVLVFARHYRRFNKTTIYRSIDSLLETGVIIPIHFPPRAVRYELPSHHHHIMCRGCGQIDHIEDSEIEPVLIKSQQSISVQKKYRSIHHELSFIGTCETCAQSSLA